MVAARIGIIALFNIDYIILMFHVNTAFIDNYFYMKNKIHYLYNLPVV